MKLYEFAPAPNPRRVRMFLAEKGITTENIQVDIPSGEQLGEEHRKRNPTLDLPVLELDDGTHIHQVNAICRYLEETHPDNPLFGRTAIERAKVEAWNHQIVLNGLMAVAEAYRNSAEMFKDRAIPGPHNYPQSPELAERGFMRMPNFYNDMEKHFSSNQYVVGDYFSIADITAYITIDFAKWVKQSIPDTHTHLQRWYDQITARPSSAA